MDFHLTDLQRMMADAAEKFAKKEILPWLERKGDTREMIGMMGKVGFFGCAFPPRL